jgi:hypothetical protein
VRPMLTKAERMAHANDILLSVSRHGRRFFYCPRADRVARFEMDAHGCLRFRDEYTDRVIRLVKGGKWRGFNNGGTLRRLVEDLAEYIRTGEKIRNHFGPWPEWICDGDLWGYGESIKQVRSEIGANPAFCK